MSSVGEQEVDEGSKIGNGHSVLVIDIGSIVVDGVSTSQEVINERSKIYDIDFAVGVNVTFEDGCRGLPALRGTQTAYYLMVGIIMPFDTLTGTHIQCCGRKPTVAVAIPAKVEMELTFHVITVADEGVTHTSTVIMCCINDGTPCVQLSP